MLNKFELKINYDHGLLSIQKDGGDIWTWHPTTENPSVDSVMEIIRKFVIAEPHSINEL